MEVKGMSGPLLINGGDGEDIVYAHSDGFQLDYINALLTFDGGDDGSEDVLIVDNSGDTALDDVLNLTRLIIQVDSMQAPDINATDDVLTEKNPVLPHDSFLVTLRGGTGGSFSLTLDDPSTSRTDLETAAIDYPPNAASIIDAINAVLIPNSNSCGQQYTSVCASSSFVSQLGNSDTYAIFFIGERLNSGTIITSLNATSLDNFYEEIFNNKTNEVVEMNADIGYTNVETLSVAMGHQDVVVNIRGTSAETTNVTTQEGNDKVFISSDAAEDEDSVGDAEVLYGVLDYINGDLYVNVGTGRHRLFMSDSFSDIPKGVGTDGIVHMTNSSLMNLADELGNIYFDTGGDWLDDVTLWMGNGGDQIEITSIHSVGSPTRTMTTVNSGKGDDFLSTKLLASENGGDMFIANGQVSVF